MNQFVCFEFYSKDGFTFGHNNKRILTGCEDMRFNTFPRVVTGKTSLKILVNLGVKLLSFITEIIMSFTNGKSSGFKLGSPPGSLLQLFLLVKNHPHLVKNCLLKFLSSSSNSLTNVA